MNAKWQGVKMLSYDQANLINGFRILMSKLAYLTRFYIVESITGIGDKELTYQEFLKLPEEGDQLVKATTGLDFDFTPVTLRYINGLKNLIDGMVSGDQAKSDESIQQLYQVSDQNAHYLAQLSPYWDEATWQGIFYRYNSDLVAEVLAIKNGDYNKALDIFQVMMQEAMIRGDYYAEGFIHLLPEDQQQIPPAYFNMIKDFRQISTEWTYLSRFYMVARITGLGNEKYVTERFYALTSRMKEKFELILGTEQANNVLNLTSIYTIRLEELITAVLSGDQAAIDAKVNEVYQSTDELAAYLSSINPYWNVEKWEELLHTYIGFLVEVSTALQKKNYLDFLQTFEKLLYSALSIGDYYALGLYQYATKKAPVRCSFLSNGNLVNAPTT